MNKTKKLKHKYIPEKFKDVESFTFTTSNDELMVVFHGFEKRAMICQISRSSCSIK